MKFSSAYRRTDIVKYFNTRVYIDRDYIQSMNPDVVVEDESWRPFVIDPSLEISNWGNIRRIAYEKTYLRHDYGWITRHCQQHQYQVNANEEGYLVVNTKDNKQYSCHRAVAITFLDLPEDYIHKEVDHKDFNTNNPYYKNLQWVTPEENRARSALNVRSSNGRPVVEFKSGKQYDTIESMALDFKENYRQVYNAMHYMKSQKGYSRKYDILIRYVDELDRPWGDYSYEDRMHILNDARISAVRQFCMPGIRCITDGTFYPNAFYAARKLNTPSGAIHDAIYSSNGYYKKLNMQFEKVQSEDITDEEIMQYMDHYLWAFSQMKGKGSDRV